METRQRIALNGVQREAQARGEDPGLLPHQVATLCGVSVQTIYNWTLDGRFHPFAYQIRPGGQWRYPMSKAVEYADGQS